MNSKRNGWYWYSVTIIAIGLSISAQAISSVFDCGELWRPGGIEPSDYADPSSSVPTGADPMGRIKRVENVHFQPSMQTLDIKLFPIDRLTAEFRYTLELIPNHPRALLAMSKLEKMAGGKLPQRTVSPTTPKITADCFFDRAMRFRPNDKAVRMVYGMHLHQRGKFNEALIEYELAESLGEDSASFYYNLGLLHADMRNWDKAYEYADKAQRAGVMLPGLRGKLEKAGRPLPVLVQPGKAAMPELSPTPAVPE